MRAVPCRRVSVTLVIFAWNIIVSPSRKKRGALLWIISDWQVVADRALKTVNPLRVCPYRFICHSVNWSGTVKTIRTRPSLSVRSIGSKKAVSVKFFRI